MVYHEVKNCMSETNPVQEYCVAVVVASCLVSSCYFVWLSCAPAWVANKYANELQKEKK